MHILDNVSERMSNDNKRSVDSKHEDRDRDGVSRRRDVTRGEKQQRAVMYVGRTVIQAGWAVTPAPVSAVAVLKEKTQS